MPFPYPVNTLTRTCRYLFAVAVALAFSAAPALAQSKYFGNQSTGFGSPLGKSTLSITDNATSGLISFNLSTGNGGGFNNIAFYFSTGSGGLSNTSTLTDTGDDGRRSITGQGVTSGQSPVSFAAGFSAKYAVALDANGNANLFQIVPGQSYLSYVSGANYTNTSAGNYGFSFNATALGLTAGSGSSFDFVATLSNPSSGNFSDGSPMNDVYRSNETIGASNLDNNAVGNPGVGGTGLIYSGFDTYTLSVPEPSTYLGGLALVVCGLVVYRRSRNLQTV